MSISKAEVVARYLPKSLAPGVSAEAFAPSNIALCKYWGKRDAELNLPINSSLSISLAKLGTHTCLSESVSGQDEVWLNGESISSNSTFAKKLLSFIGLFRGNLSQPLRVVTTNTVPTAAGLASSASGFAALMMAINEFYRLSLPSEVLSAFARMGSGSASRSLYHGFVEWQMGVREDGMDSHAQRLDLQWPEFRIGLLKLSTEQKAVDSRSGMGRTLETSHLYSAWPMQAALDLEKLRAAVFERSIDQLGSVAEHNSLSMHATMISSWPPLLYWLPESVAVMRQVWALREQGMPVYFTMDAGPNIKLLFTKEHQVSLQQAFPLLEVVEPFSV